MKRTTEILELLDQYEDVVSKAKEMGVISTKNFVGDIIETLVCGELKAKKCKASQKGYDAIRGNDKIQIKYRSKNNKGEYKITFKNVNNKNVGFNVLAFCCKTEEGYSIFEIKVEDLPEMKFIEKKNRKVLFLNEEYLSNKNKINRIDVGRKGVNSYTYGLPSTDGQGRMHC
jgi:arabinogalactan endo-1,4-beta-galactosidase